MGDLPAIDVDQLDRPVGLLGGQPFAVSAEVKRLMARRGHFMPPQLLASQFATLEEPEGVLTVDIAQPPDRIVHDIRRAFAL